MNKGLVSFILVILGITIPDFGGTGILSRKIEFGDITISPLGYDTVTTIKVEVIADKVTTPTTIAIYISNNSFTKQQIAGGIVNYNQPEIVYTYLNEYTRSNNTITVEYPGEKLSTVTLTANMKVGEPKSITINKTDQTYTSDTCEAIISKTGTTYKTEKIRFKGFDSLYVPDFYHYFDFSHITISRESSLGLLKSGGGYFSISNVNHSFDLLANNKNSVQIPIKLYEKGNEIYGIKFANSLYVNPYTLEMSLTKRVDFVETNKLYFPKNQMQSQSEYACNIALYSLGVDQSSFYNAFKINALMNNVGDCYNSEYCVIKTSDNPSPSSGRELND